MIKLKNHPEKIDKLLGQWKDEEYVNAFFSQELVDKASGPPTVEERVRGLTVKTFQFNEDQAIVSFTNGMELVINYIEHQRSGKIGALTTSLFSNTHEN